MGIQSRSLLQQQFEQIFERACTTKVRLIRANPFTCPGPVAPALCFKNGRKDINNNCPVCAGTGYLGVSFDNSNPRQRIVTVTGDPYDDTAAPASKFFYIWADVQTGHGLYGAGGDYLKLLADIGKQLVGDATIFTKMYDRDHATGQVIYPIVDPSLPRPDRVISRHGSIYNVVQEILIEVGSETICRSFTTEQGSFTALRGTAGGR